VTSILAFAANGGQPKAVLVVGEFDVQSSSFSLLLSFLVENGKLKLEL